jgi:hypothetical protein
MAHDTSVDASKVHRDVFARMTGSDRVDAATEMAETARQLSLSGLRTRHPEYDDQQLKWAWFELLLGEDLTTAALGPDPRS